MQDGQGLHLRQVLARWQQYRTAFQLTDKEAEEAMKRRINGGTHQMSQEEVKRLGLFRRPPGLKAGSTLHPRKHLLSQSDVVVLGPLAFMVTFAIGLAVMTAYRELVINPTVELDKRRRRDPVVEIEVPEEVLARSRRMADSPFRRFSAQVQQILHRTRRTARQPG